MMCVQQNLGIGYVVVKSQSQFVYSNFKDEYACFVSGHIYQCEKKLIEGLVESGGANNK